jgi:hypothetical protein
MALPQLQVRQETTSSKSSDARKKCRESREQVMKRAALSMRELSEALTAAAQQLHEGDLDLADLIAPAR